MPYVMIDCCGKFTEHSSPHRVTFFFLMMRTFTPYFFSNFLLICVQTFRGCLAWHTGAPPPTGGCRSSGVSHAHPPGCQRRLEFGAGSWEEGSGLWAIQCRRWLELWMWMRGPGQRVQSEKKRGPRMGTWKASVFHRRAGRICKGDREGAKHSFTEATF